MEPLLEEALTIAFPDREIAEIEQPPESQHPGNQTFRITFSTDAQVYLKLVTDGDSKRIQRAAAVLQYLGTQRDVRVPRMLSSQTEREPYYIATAALPGTAIVNRWEDASIAECESMLYHVGQTVGRLHSVQFDQSGVILGGTAHKLTLEEDSWVTVLCKTIDARAQTVFSDRFTEFPSRVQQVLREQREILEEVPVSLLHGDPNRKNCLVQTTDGPVRLVDWEESLVGDPVFDLCRVEATQIEQPPVRAPDKLRRALRAGYQSQAGSLPNGYEERAPIYQVVTFLKPAQTFEFWAPNADESVAELETWIRDEIQRRINGLDADR